MVPPAQSPAAVKTYGQSCGISSSQRYGFLSMHDRKSPNTYSSYPGCRGAGLPAVPSTVGATSKAAGRSQGRAYSITVVVPPAKASAHVGAVAETIAGAEAVAPEEASAKPVDGKSAATDDDDERVTTSKAGSKEYAKATAKEKQGRTKRRRRSTGQNGTGHRKPPQGGKTRRTESASADASQLG